MPGCGRAFSENDMSEQKVMHTFLKGMITEMPEEQQKKVAELADKIRAVIAEDETCGTVAITLVSCEITT